MANYVPRTDDGHCYRNPISATRLLVETIGQVEEEPGRFDISAFHDSANDYLEQVIGPERPDETPDAYKIRVFAELLERCTEHHTDGVAAMAQECRDVLAVYAKEALEAGDLETASRWCSELNANTGAKDPTCWTLYGTFCARKRHWDEALKCAQKAVALDGRNRIAMFFNAALLITNDSEQFDEIDALFDRLESLYPWFGEAHFLSAVYNARMEMPDRTDHFLSLARMYVNVQTAVSWPENAVLDGAPMAVWDPVVHHGGDPAVRCATLLIRLGLSELAAMCLRCFARRSDHPALYHYLMAVSHHKLDEFQACLDHLNAMPVDDGDFGRRRSLLAAHNDFGAGRAEIAEARFVELSSGPTLALYGLAYSRLADYLVSSKRYAEATDTLFRACTVVTGRGTPVLLTKLGSCLLMLNKYPEAEKVLAAALAFDGAHNGDAWYYLAEVYTKSNRSDMADVCYRQAAELMDFKSVRGPVYDLLSHKYN